MSVSVIVFILTGATELSANEPSAEEIGPVRVLQSDTEALDAIFPKADSAVMGILETDSLLLSWLKERLKRGVADSVFTYYSIYQNDTVVGTAVVTEERGKYRPITFIAGVDNQLRIVDARVLVYRESRGGDVRRTRFLKQYRKKSLDDPIRINRDIINITGATISVNALNAGIRKVLAVVEYLRRPPTERGETQ